MDEFSSTYTAWSNLLQLEDAPHGDSSWSQLNSQNQMEHNRDVQQRRYLWNNASTSIENSTQENLNNLECPEFDQIKAAVKSIADRLASTNETDDDDEKSSDPYEMLEAAIADCVYNRKQSGKMKKDNRFKANTNKLNIKRLYRMNILLMKEYSTVKRNGRLSDIHRMIALKRTISIMNMKCLSYKKMEKLRQNNVNVNSINLNSLKIKSDPKMDIDYVKRMSTLNIYDKNYRHSIGENVSEDTVQYRSDVTQKFDQLNISNVQNKNICISPYKNSVDGINNLDVSLNSNLSFNNENNVDVKPNISFDLKYSKNFREYCNNLVTLSLNESLDKFLSEIRRLQSKLYNRDKTKGKYKRRYYSGLKEVTKHVVLKKVRFVIIAPDIENIVSAGGLNEEVDKLLEISRKNETPYCFGLRRRKLGYYAHGNGFVSCIGISNYANAEELFWNVLVEVIKARNSFEKLQGKSKEMVDVSKLTQENGLLTENIKVVLKSLTMIT